MRPISEAEIERKQWQYSQSMQDEGYILRQVGSVWTPDAEPTRCRVQDGITRKGNVTLTQIGTPADSLELPYGTDFDNKDRFRLTTRSGLAITPIDYIPIDQPARDAIRVAVEVRRAQP